MMKSSLFPRRLFARFCSFAKCDKSRPEIGRIKMCLEFPLLENRAVGENLYICFENLQKYFYCVDNLQTSTKFRKEPVISRVLWLSTWKHFRKLLRKWPLRRIHELSDDFTFFSKMMGIQYGPNREAKILTGESDKIIQGNTATREKISRD